MGVLTANVIARYVLDRRFRLGRGSAGAGFPWLPCGAESRVPRRAQRPPSQSAQASGVIVPTKCNPLRMTNLQFATIKFL